MKIKAEAEDLLRAIEMGLLTEDQLTPEQAELLEEQGS